MSDWKDQVIQTLEARVDKLNAELAEERATVAKEAAEITNLNKQLDALKQSLAKEHQLLVAATNRNKRWQSWGASVMNIWRKLGAILHNFRNSVDFMNRDYVAVYPRLVNPATRGDITPLGIFMGLQPADMNVSPENRARYKVSRWDDKPGVTSALVQYNTMIGVELDDNNTPTNAHFPTWVYNIKDPSSNYVGSSLVGNMYKGEYPEYWGEWPSNAAYGWYHRMRILQKFCEQMYNY